MKNPRVLVVDDSVVVRKILTDVVAGDARLEVAGTAPNGRVALTRIAELRPDIVTLDVEMPEMDGLQTLVAIRARHPRLPVVMLSTLTERGAATTLDALMRGANDYVTKPTNTGSPAAAIAMLREVLVPKLKALCGIVDAPPPRRSVPAPAPAPAGGTRPDGTRPGAPARPARGPVEVVVIGVSTGGPNALAEVVPLLPRDLPVPVLIVQHMPPNFTRMLAERLDGRSPLTVAEGVHGAAVAPGQVWIAPGDKHMEVRSGGAGVQLALHHGPPENSCRPAADVLFRSATATYGGVLGVVLTGMGRDGLRGAEAIRAAGGQVLAQDEQSSVVWGMPGAVAAAGLVDAIVPLSEVPGEIVRRARSRRPLAADTRSAR